MRGATETVARTGVWPTIVGLVVLWVAAVANQVWVFALLFVGWALLDVATGESHFIQRITRRENPKVFWSIVGSWIVMSVLWVVAG
ncbi:MAG: hypothetical protein AAF467_14940 [Actinomycetota bacterium]